MRKALAVCRDILGKNGTGSGWSFGKHKNSREVERFKPENKRLTLPANLAATGVAKASSVARSSPVLDSIPFNMPKFL
jgi:hypothetical protein